MAKKGKTRSPKSKRKSVMHFNFGDLFHARVGEGRHASNKPQSHH